MSHSTHAGNLRKRKNMAESAVEYWQPPAYSSSPSLANRLLSRVRRFLDLQYASIWADMAAELPAAHGTVLDVGCGAQPVRCLFSSDVRYIGIDTIDAKAHFGYEVPDTLYFEGDTWPVKDRSIDFMLC